jgi:prevent-host-death family protein
MARLYSFGIQFFTYILTGVITLQVQLAEIKNKMSEYVRAVQNGSTFEITVRGVPVAMLVPIAKPASKSGFQARVLSLMASPSAPKLDTMAALQEGRK